MVVFRDDKKNIYIALRSLRIENKIPFRKCSVAFTVHMLQYHWTDSKVLLQKCPVNSQFTHFSLAMLGPQYSYFFSPEVVRSFNISHSLGCQHLLRTKPCTLLHAVEHLVEVFIFCSPYPAYSMKIWPTVYTKCSKYQDLIY